MNEDMPAAAVRLAERLWGRTVAGPGNCIIWTGSTATYGYGSIWAYGRQQRVHRVAYELHKGPIPDGLHIDHLRRVRACVNPWHLEAVPQGENTRRGWPFRKRLTHCKYGHEYTPENVYVRPDGTRSCRICGRTRLAKYRGKS